MKTLFDDGYAKVGVDEGEEGIMLWISQDYRDAGGRMAVSEMTPSDLLTLSNLLQFEAMKRIAGRDE